MPVTIGEEARLYRGAVPAASIWPDRLLHTGMMGPGSMGEAGRGTSKALLSSVSWEEPRHRVGYKERIQEDVEGKDLDFVGIS